MLPLANALHPTLDIHTMYILIIPYSGLRDKSILGTCYLLFKPFLYRSNKSFVISTIIVVESEVTNAWIRYRYYSFSSIH